MRGFHRRIPRRLWVAGAVAVVVLLLAAWQFGLVRGPIQDRSLMNTARIRSDQTGRQWAEKMQLAGVPNLYKVSSDLYRGAQPTEEGLKALRSLGVKTIVNLRTLHSDRPRLGDANGMFYAQIATQPWAVTDEDVIQFLRIVTDPNKTPIFVHCQRGADRTGTVCAVYRMALQGWTLEQALDEMTHGGFGFYEGWKDLVEYLRHLDVEWIRGQCGLVKSVP
jgi:tyrosine-protein phosphatase SIW14